MSWDFGGGGSGSGSGGQRPSNDGWSDLSSPAPSTSQGFGGFDQQPSGGSSLIPSGAGGATAPVLWLGLGIGMAVVAMVVHFLGSGFWPGLAGWLIGGPVVIGLLAVFVNQDTARRADPWYAESAIAPWARRLLVIMSLAAVALNSISIADFFARGGF